MMPGAMGSSVSRPYYYRRGGAPPVRTALGTVALGFAYGFKLAGVVVNAGESVLAAAVTERLDVAGTMVARIGAPPGGTILAGTVLKYSFGVPACDLWVVCADASNGAWAGDLVLDITAAPMPTFGVMLASKVTNLLTTASEDQVKGAVGTSATQDSGLTGATAQASEFIWGVIGNTQALVGDSAGVWQAGMTAGQYIKSAGTGPPNGTSLKEGYQTVAAVSTYQAKTTGGTSRRYMARCHTYKGN